MIPKVIHQIWMGGEIPGEELSMSESWRRLNPDHKMILWSDSSINKHHFDELRIIDWSASPFAYHTGVVNRLFPGKKRYSVLSDMWRYSTIFRHGGAYADLDTVCCAPVNEWVGEDELTVFQDNEGKFDSLSCWFLCAKPRHPAVASVIRFVMSRVDEKSCPQDVVYASDNMAITAAISSRQDVLSLPYPHRYRAGLPIIDSCCPVKHAFRGRWK